MVLSSTLTAALAMAYASSTDAGVRAVAASGKVFFDLKLEGAPAGRMLPLVMGFPRQSVMHACTLRDCIARGYASYKYSTGMTVSMTSFWPVCAGRIVVELFDDVKLGSDRFRDLAVGKVWNFWPQCLKPLNSCASLYGLRHHWVVGTLPIA